MSLLDVQDTVRDFLEREYYGNSMQRIAIALGVLIVGTIFLGVVKRVVLARLKKLAKRTETDLDDLLLDLGRRTSRIFLFAIALYVASHMIEWPRPEYGADEQGPSIASRWERYIQSFLTVAFWIQVGMWGVGLVRYGISHALREKSHDDPARTMGVTVLGFIGQVIVWSLVALLSLDNMGVNVNSLIASLGVGGIAVALAAQNVLGDLFASIAILLDKPFVVGDAVQIGDFNGTVERIGVKTTRLRSVNGEEIVMGNNDLVSSRMRNFKRLTERRVVLTFSVEYGTPAEQVERIPSLLKEIITAEPATRFDRAHLAKLGDSALVFEAVYFVLSAEYGVFMDTQQKINLEILKRFQSEHVALAFPTQNVRWFGDKPPPVSSSPAG
jgi:small-conductance mechanosensitive channel